MISEGFWAVRVPGVTSGGWDPGAGIPEDSGRIPGYFPPLAEGSPGLSGEASGRVPGSASEKGERAGVLPKLHILLPINRPCGRYVNMIIS